MSTQKELAAQWIVFGYRKGMASATITPPPTKAFRRVYHMMQGKWALVAIDDQRLKVSRFEDLNDPFELLAMNRHTQSARKASKQFRLTPHMDCCALAPTLRDQATLIIFGNHTKMWNTGQRVSSVRDDPLPAQRMMRVIDDNFFSVTMGSMRCLCPAGRPRCCAISGGTSIA
jgi:hypothetical protein